MRKSTVSLGTFPLNPKSRDTSMGSAQMLCLYLLIIYGPAAARLSKGKYADVPFTGR
ncbi:hypothetical protein BDZ94DRAFT_1261565 [Collybia nuda]|uniref:Uncharacterized protein n=1 Tax=Collybia nuda TaxID=64659 RepID=A0A9P5Y2W8_9AGAR|nr:hypothetical protein BDZ94DRAFT_1261565 [Collybia nuda]